MNRDTVFAILIGFGIGTLFAASLFFLPKLTSKSSPSQPTSATQTLPQITSAPKRDFELSLEEPQDGAVTTSPNLTISGSTRKKATIVLLGPNTEKVLITDNDGIFSETISLIKGINHITITAYSSTGDEVSESRTVARALEENQE